MSKTPEAPAVPAPVVQDPPTKPAPLRDPREQQDPKEQ